MPSINLKMIDFLHKFANTSIDISDGLLIDLDKMTKQQTILTQQQSRKHINKKRSAPEVDLEVFFAPRPLPGPICKFFFTRNGW